VDGLAARLSSQGAALVRLFLPLGLLPLLVACGTTSNSTTSSTNAPTISNLRVAYVPAPPVTGQAVQVVFFVDVSDPNGDWVGGTCSFTSSSVNVPIQAPGLSATATSGTGQCVTSGTFTNTTVQVSLVVVDRAGNESNTLTGSVNVERPDQL